MDEEFRKHGTSLFVEIPYNRRIAEAFFSSQVFMQESDLNKLQVALYVFSFICERNQLDIGITRFSKKETISEFLLEKINESCPGNSEPIISKMDVNTEIKVLDRAKAFFDYWFVCMDGFPESDYHYFLKQLLLPLLKSCLNDFGPTKLRELNKRDRSYQHDSILTFSGGEEHLVLHMVCFIY